MDLGESESTSRSPHSAVRTRLVGLALLTSVPLGISGCDRPPPRGEPIPVTATLGSLGDTPGRFACPRAMDPDGDFLWVIDRSARVQRIDPRTGLCTALWHMPDSANGKPVGFTVAPGPANLPDGATLPPGAAPPLQSNLLYIADTHYNRVMVYRPPPPPPARPGRAPAPDLDAPARELTPDLVAKFGSYGTGPGQFIYPTDVAVLMSADGTRVERIYVSEYGGNDRISVFDASYNFLFSFGSPGGSADPEHIQFDRPQSLAIDDSVQGGGGKAELIVTDSRNHRIGRFTLDGRLIAWLGSPEAAGDGLGQFRYPYGLALLHDGTALIAEYGNNRVQRIDLKTGQGLGAWGVAGRGDGQLATPWAIAVIGATTYILDTGNNRILAFPTPPIRAKSS